MFTKTALLPGDGYTPVPHFWVRDHRVSERARLILIYWSGHSVGYRVTMQQTMAEMGCGKDALYAAVKELLEHGYLVRMQDRQQAGRFAAVEYTHGPAAAEPTYQRAWGVCAGPTASGFSGTGAAGRGESATKKISSKKISSKKDQTPPPPATPEPAAAVVAEAVTGEGNTSTTTTPNTTDAPARPVAAAALAQLAQVDRAPTPEVAAVVADVVEARHETTGRAWSPNNVRGAVDAALRGGRPLDLVREAAILVARDPKTTTINRLASDQCPWWAVAQANIDRARLAADSVRQAEARKAAAAAARTAEPVQITDRGKAAREAARAIAARKRQETAA